MLAELPVEILRRIAKLSTAETVLSLSLCSKSIRSACYDPFVFRGVIMNRNGHNPVFHHSWNISFLDNSTSVSTLAHYAIADSRARSWKALPRIGHDQRRDKVFETHVKWAPQLAALGHPFVSELDLISYISQLRASSLDNRDCLDLLPVLYGAILSHGAHELLADSLLSKELGRLLRDGTSRSEYLGILVSIFHGMLSPTREGFTLDSPRLERIPLSKIMTNPSVPFTFVNGRHLDRACHLTYMTSKEFVEDGEWAGYYSYDTPLSLDPLLDPPMQRISLRVSEETSIDAPLDTNNHISMTGISTLHVAGSGTDTVGNFVLSGQIYSDGRVQMTKMYNSGLSWNWEANMTQMGIMGYWGDGFGERYGCIWLWKRAWSS